MKHFIFLLLALLSASAASAQKMEPILDSNQSLFMQMPEDSRFEWLIQMSEKQKASAQDYIDYSLYILPDTIYAGEPFDVYYTVDSSHGDATVVLYGYEGTRKKKLLSQDFQCRDRASFSVMIRVSIDRPGRYELTACQLARPESVVTHDETSHQTFVVHERPANP